MRDFVKTLLLGAALAGLGATQGWAADLAEPVVEEAPAQVAYAEPYSGWYIRGDVDYHWSKFKEGEYVRYGDPTFEDGRRGTIDGDLEEAWSGGVGLGYQINRHLRTDLTVDYLGKADFRGDTVGECLSDPLLTCTSTDRSSYSAWLLLANVYAELGTYHGFTPYIGAGIGGAHVKWDKLTNTIEDESFEHDGEKGWRFAYALMAGTSYCLTKNLDLDIGYRYAHVESGDMFGYASGVGPGEDGGINVHEVRGGLRYKFGGGRSECGAPEPVAYEPVEPVYTK